MIFKQEKRFMTFGQKLKQLRKEKRFSQSDIANFLKVDQTTISVWELDKCEPNFKTLKTISIAFNVSIDELLSDY